MGISLRLSAEEEVLLERAASQLRLSKSEFIRRSIANYAAQVIPAENRVAEIDALYIGQGGGLREPSEVKNPQKRAVLDRLRKKHGYAD